METKKYVIDENQFFIQRFHKFTIDQAKTLYNKGFMNDFYVEYEPIIQNQTRYVAYTMYIKYTSFTKPIIEIRVDESGEIDDIEIFIPLRNQERYIYIFIWYLLNDFEGLDYEALEQKFAEIARKKYEKDMQIKKAVYEKMLAAAMSNVKKYDNASPNKKVKIECWIRRGLQGLVLACKVGYDKMYFINDVANFLANVENSNIVSYGKSLAFNHNFNSFDDASKEIIKFLRGFGSSSFESKRDIRLNIATLERVIELNKNRYICLDFLAEGSLFYVTGEKILPKIKLGENFQVTIPEIDYAIKGYLKNYAIKEHKIYEIDNSDQAYSDFLMFIFSRKIDDYDIVKDLFLDKAYPRFSHLIDVSEKLKKDVVFDDYTIKAYFDYDNDQITVENKIFKNNEEIQLQDIKTIPYSMNRYFDYLENLGFNKGTIKDEKLISNFVRADLSELKTLAQIYLSDKLTSLNVKKYSSPKISFSYGVDFLNISLFSSEFSNEELYEILKAIKKKKRFVKLKNNTIIDIEEEDGQKLLNTVDAFNLEQKELTKEISVPLYQIFKTTYDYVDIIDYKNDERLVSLVNEIVNFKDNNFAPSEKFDKVMRDYQKDAFKWMKTLTKHGFCGILADDMGLGKTLEVISVIASDENQKPSLIVCPKSLCYNWKNEFRKWDSEIEVENIIGTIEERKEIIENIKPDKKKIYISSYDSLRNDIELYKKQNFAFLILDEAQSIKNDQTLKAKSVKKIKSLYRFVLTGTPIENSVMDLWSLFDFLMPLYLGDQKEFKARYLDAVAKGNATEVVNGLIRKISPFVLRRTKKEVLKDLPDKIETIRIATFDDEQQKLYDANILSFKQTLEDPKVSKVEILALLTRLRQICVNPKLYYANYKGESAKFNLLFELIDEYTNLGHKIIVFSQFTSALSLIEDELKKQKIKYFTLTGKTKAEDRIQMADKFNNEKDQHKVFLVSLKAGGTGLNLVGADIVIHLDPWWNYAVENQATDRSHRIGQKNVVQVIKLIAQDTIEQRVIELQKIKKEVAEKIIISDEQNYNSIALTDIKYLLE